MKVKLPIIPLALKLQRNHGHQCENYIFVIREFVLLNLSSLPDSQ